MEEAEKTAKKLEKKEQRLFEKEIKKGIKEHYERQSDRTKAAMKISKKKADAFNNQNKKCFVIRIYDRLMNTKEKRVRSKRHKRKRNG